jgi:peptidoglycan/xylan/chitin deacetylase (PgdA/CDA1 family)
VVAVPVLLYHSISERAHRNEGRWTVSPRAFAVHVETLQAAGCTALKVTELAACLRGEQVLPPRPVAVTFDDGYADVVEAVALLVDRGLASTTFVTSGSVGAAGMVSHHALAELRGMPSAEVGAHGVRHRRLDELAPEHVADEVRGSRAQLEELLQAPVTAFAYPHGAYDRRVRGAVIDAGYEAAAAVKNALSHSDDDPFAIARCTVTADTSPRSIRELLDGQGIRLAWQQERVRTRTSRAVRRLRRRVAAAAHGRSAT